MRQHCGWDLGRLVLVGLTAAVLAVLASSAPAQTSSWQYDVDGYWGDATKWSGGVPNGDTADARFRRSFTGDRVVALAANAQGDPLSVTLNQLTFWDWSGGDDTTLTIRAVTKGSQESDLTFAGTASISSQTTISDTKATQIDSTGLRYLAALRIDSKVNISGPSLTKTGGGSAVFFREVSGAGNLIVSQGLLILAAQNTYTGSTTVSGGALQLRH
ncbi:MAG: hypothetical protein NZ602_05385, partial [Thermoguttaceae bacterium]|nr:hypothetical protein [Thermoguttaceae bacterium]